jgi:ADP-heptose:LPS heptosyltransferase
LHVSRAEGLGDVLLCTPALREVKRINPRARISFYTRYPGLLDGLPFIDEIKDHAVRPSETIEMTYGHHLPPTRHIARIMGETIGVSVRDVRPACVIDLVLVTRFRTIFQSLPRPHIVINRNASHWTPNKTWPMEHWDELVEKLAREATVIEIGSAFIDAQITPSTGNYISLIGTTTVDELIAVIAATDVLVSPISGPVHVAAAAGIPTVVIYGGYEHPLCSHYPGNINLYTPASCAPCWLRTPCPYDRQCMHAISPYTVEQAIRVLTGWR